MSVIKDNSIYEKTSFLSKSNNAFIESLYLKYINSDPELSQDWNEFFDGLGDETKYILNEIQGPSWAPKKINIKNKIPIPYNLINNKHTCYDLIYNPVKTSFLNDRLNIFLSLMLQLTIQNIM